MWFPLNTDNRISDYGEVTANKMLAERTGITIDYIHPRQERQANLLITSGDYPMIYHGSVTYNGGWDKAVEDGIYLNSMITLNSTLPTIRLSGIYPSGA